MNQDTDNQLITNTNDTTYDHVIKYTGLFGGVQGLSMLINVVRNMVTAKLLGPVGIAFINIFNKTTGLLNQATNFGISMSAVKHMATLYDKGDECQLRDFAHTVRSWSTLTAVIGTVLTLMLAPLLSLWEFKDYSQTLSFVMLAPVVGILSLTSGEMAILKGIKQLKKVAVISVFTAAATLFVSVPLYLIWGIGSIAATLLLCSITSLIIHLHYSTRTIPWSSTPFSLPTLRRGMPMIWLGIAFIVAGVFGEGSFLTIQMLIKDFGSMDDVGLYNCSFTLVVTCASIVFVAMDADYFPRLSAAEHDLTRQNQTVNQQIEVCMILIVPCLVLFLTTLPFIVPFLYSGKFLPAVPTVVYSSVFMFVRAMCMPISYLSLAKGDSRTYMAIELIYDIVCAVLIPFAFLHWGLPGAGIALSLCSLIDFGIIYIVFSIKYQFRMRLSHARTLLLQTFIYLLSLYIAMQLESWPRYIAGSLLFLLSASISFRIIKKETQLSHFLKNKLWKKNSNR